MRLDKGLHESPIVFRKIYALQAWEQTQNEQKMEVLVSLHSNVVAMSDNRNIAIQPPAYSKGRYIGSETAGIYTEVHCTIPDVKQWI